MMLVVKRMGSPRAKQKGARPGSPRASSKRARTEPPVTQHGSHPMRGTIPAAADLKRVIAPRPYMPMIAPPQMA